MTVQQPATPPPGPRPGEASALTKVMWFGVLQVVGIAAGWASSFYLFGSVYTSTGVLSLTNSTTPADLGNILAPLFRNLTTVVLVSGAIEVVGLIILTLAFRELRGADGRAFSLPSILTIIMVVGALATFAGSTLLLGGLSGVISQVPTANTTPSAAFTSALSSLLSALALVGIGGLLAFIGLVGGQILGLWRVGSRYDETIIKVGAIFAIIPVLNIAAPVLVIVGAHQARQKVSSVA